MQINLSWTTLKAKQLPLRYVEAHGNYYIFANSVADEFTCRINANSADATDFINNYKNDAAAIG